MQDDIQVLLMQAEQDIASAEDISELENVRVKFLGKQGHVTQLMQQLGRCSPEQRPLMGKAINDLKQAIQTNLNTRKDNLQSEALAKQLSQESIDVTLPGRAALRHGSLHPITQIIDRLNRFFVERGFTVASGPEIEDEWHNFTALNTPEHHPAREMQATFYLENKLLLRTQTSPVQIRVMKSQAPPIRVIVPGRVYRCDSDHTHSPMFHQMEGLVVDENCSFAELKYLLHAFLTAFFGREITLRMRPSYFPFTEPSAEIDIQCVNCEGAGCRVCSHSGWLEVLGCGMVHPNVFAHVGIDSSRFRGYAFGVGLDRLAMLYYRIPDLRILFDNDVDFLRQF